jgi:hypothetical protein
MKNNPSKKANSTQQAKTERVGVTVMLYTPIREGNIKTEIKCSGFEGVDSIQSLWT